MRLSVQPVAHVVTVLRAMLLVDAECGPGDLFVVRRAAWAIVMTVVVVVEVEVAHAAHGGPRIPSCPWGENPSACDDVCEEAAGDEDCETCTRGQRLQH